MNCFKTLSRET